MNKRKGKGMMNVLLMMVMIVSVLVSGCIRDIDGNVSADLLSIEDSAMIGTALITAVVDRDGLDIDKLIFQVQTMKILVSQNPEDVIPVLQTYVNTQVEPRYRTVTGLTIQIVIRRASPILTSDLPEEEKQSQVAAIATAVLNGVETALQLHKLNTQGGQ